MKDCASSLHIGLHIPTLWVSSCVTSISVNQKKEGSTYGTKPSLMAMQARPPCCIPFLPTFLRLLNLITLGGTPRSLGSYVLYQELIGSLLTYLWLKRVTFTVTPASSRISGTRPFRAITRQYVWSFENCFKQGQQGRHIPGWMSKHPVFCSILKWLHDDHRYSEDPCSAFAEFKAICEKPEKQAFHELEHLAMKHGSLLGIVLSRSLSNVMTSRSSVRSLRTLLVKILRNVKRR